MDAKLAEVNARKHTELIQSCVKQCRFYQLLTHFSAQDKLDLVKCFEVKCLKPGQRFYKGTDRIDSFNLVVKGKVGVFYPDAPAIKQATANHRLVCCNEAERQKRMLQTPTPLKP
jgi:hypothetical protein